VITESTVWAEKQLIEQYTVSQSFFDFSFVFEIG